VKHNQGNTITVFGHAVFLNAIAMVGRGRSVQGTGRMAQESGFRV
jgi:hypothetical protein